MTSTDPHRFVPKTQKEFAKDALQQLKRVKDYLFVIHIFKTVAAA